MEETQSCRLTGGLAGSKDFELRDAAVGGQIDASGITTVIRSEEQNGPGHFFGLADSAERYRWLFR